MSDLSGGQTAGPGIVSGHADEEKPHQSRRLWLGRLGAFLASIACGMAINDFSSSLGYRGLPGAFALAGVVTVAAWIRGLSPRARLARHASWLFITPGACLAGIAALSSGPTAAILTAISGTLTVGAVLVTNELLSAARLLRGVALIAIGAAGLAYGSQALTDRYTLMGVAVIVMGAGFTAEGVGTLADRDTVVEMARNLLVVGCIPFALAFALDPTPHIGGTMSAGTFPVFLGGTIILTVGAIAWIAASITGRTKLAKKSLIAYGIGAIPFGAAFFASHAPILGAAIIAMGAACIAIAVAAIGPRTIFARVQQIVEWATEEPQIGSSTSPADSQADSTTSLMPPAGTSGSRMDGEDLP